MKHRHSALHGAAPLVVLLAALGLLAGGETGAAPDAQEAPKSAVAARTGAKEGAASRAYTTETVRGKVVWLDEALERLYGVATDPAAARTATALETSGGQLLPIVPDSRGRAFAIDERLRNIDLVLPVRRYQAVPMIQIIRVLRQKADGLYEIDYWCDVCAIPMVVLKDCECCQGPTRLREQRLEPAPTSGSP
jgi:hypothetical protein